MSMDIFPRGKTFSLHGHESPLLVVEGVRYVYDENKVRCPLCGGIGTPWQGWYSCDGQCRGIAWINTGEFAIPVSFKSLNHQDAT